MRIGLQRWLIVAAMLAVALPLLAACGGDTAGDETPSDTATSSESDDGAQAIAVDLAPEIGTIDSWYNGGATSLAELRGSPVLLVFWADY